MANNFFDEEGEWKGVGYTLRGQTLSIELTRVIVGVETRLFERPGEELETMNIHFSGHDWTACLTAMTDGRLHAVWRLRSPVDDRECHQCSWMIISPIHLPGRPRALQQNGRYGGMVPVRHMYQCGYIEIEFQLQVHTSHQEEFNVYEGEAECCCAWRMKPEVLDEFMRTQKFILHGKEWGVYLRTYFGKHIAINVIDLSRMNPVHVECQALLIAQSLPNISLMQSKQMMGDRSVMFLFSPPSEFWRTVELYYLSDSCLTIGLRLLFNRLLSSRLAVDYYSLERQRITIEVFTDKDITRYVAREASTSIFDASKSQVVRSPPHWPLKKIKEMIERDTRWDPSSLTIWLCRSHRDCCSFPKAVRVDALEAFDFRLCELCDQDHASDHSVITFYLQSCRNGRPPRDLQTSVLLFFLLLDPRLNQLEYLGSVVADEKDDLFSFCSVHLRQLCGRLRAERCSFFTMESENEAMKISPLHGTLSETGLSSGSTIIVQPMNGEGERADRISLELRNLFLNSPDNQATINAPLIDDNFVRRNALCVVCQDNPQTSGFYHGETVHLCACETCARRVYDQQPCRCPICMEPVTGFVSKIF